MQKFEDRSGRTWVKGSCKSSWKWGLGDTGVECMWIKARVHCNPLGWTHPPWAVVVVEVGAPSGFSGLNTEGTFRWKEMHIEHAFTNWRGNSLALPSCGLLWAACCELLVGQDTHSHAVWEGGEGSRYRNDHSTASRTGQSSAPPAKPLYNSWGDSNAQHAASRITEIFIISLMILNNDLHL